MWKWCARGAAGACLLLLGAPLSAATADRGARVDIDARGTGPGLHRLLGVAGAAPDSAWAVGQVGDVTSRRQLVKHFDGDTWSASRGPAGNRSGLLRSVTAFGEANVWAVGNADGDSFTSHFDGDMWTEVESPSGPYSDGFASIAGTSGDDIWAVGSIATSFSGDVQTLAAHWDGVRWKRVATPSRGALSHLNGVYAIAPDDVWAVGNDQAPFVQHWDGSSWTMVDQPVGDGELTSVIGFAPDDVWAVGNVTTYYGGHTVTRPLLEHWDGFAWSLVSRRGLHMGPLGTLNQLSGTSAHDVWAVGCTLRDERHGRKTVIGHYDGVRWTRVPSPNPQPYASQCLSAVSALNPSEAWAVGTYGYNDQSYGLTHNLLAHWDGTSWTWDRSPRR